MASDLRLISALLHVMKCMERMGDQCVNVAKLIPIAGHEPPADERMLADILTMGKPVRDQVRQVEAGVLRARRRARPATSSARTTSSTTSTGSASVSRSRSATSEDRREWAMTMMLIARAIERIGDNAVDIGEQVAFVVTGLFREFEDASHPGEAAPLPPPG